MINKYILQDKIPVLETDLKKWSDWFENTDRMVAEDVIREFGIGTYFLGLDRGWHGAIELFETVVLDENNEVLYQRTYSNWVDAETGHYEMVQFYLKQSPQNIN